MPDRGQIIVSKNKVFRFGVLGLKQMSEVQVLCLAEIIEDGIVVRRGSVECALKRLRGAIVVFHVVREHHELRDVDEAFELWVPKPGGDAMSLRENAVSVVRLFHLDEDKWKPVDEEGDVGPEQTVPLWQQSGPHLPWVRNVAQINPRRKDSPF